MRRLLLVLLFLPTVLFALAPPARADERSDRLRERIEMLRRLPPEEQQRLREALERFRSLPADKRAELRQRAERVGPERLRELVGRDVDRLRRRHAALRGEKAEILRLLGGAERFAALTDPERRYLGNLAVRSFQKHVRRTLLEIAGPKQMEAWNRLPRAERREKMKAAVQQLEQGLLAAETPQSRAEILALPPDEQRRRRMKLLAEHRLSLIPSFVSAFERDNVLPFLRMDPEQRQDVARRWVERARWFEIRKRIETEVGVSRESLRLLSRLGPEEWARIRDEYDRTADLAPVERRVHLEEEIRLLHGRAALGEESRLRGRRGELRRLLREERRRRQQRRRER